MAGVFLMLREKSCSGSATRLLVKVPGCSLKFYTPDTRLLSKSCPTPLRTDHGQLTTDN